MLGRTMLGRTLRALGAVCAMMAMTAVDAAAETRKRIGEFRDWYAYTLEEGGDRVCWAVTNAQKIEPSALDHGSVLLMVSNWPSRSVRDEVSVQVGYSFQASSEVKARIGRSDFRLFTENDGAWLRDGGEDQRMVKAMKAGSDLRAAATSGRGNDTSYVFSLLGFTAAYEAMSAACGGG